jgi:hypothetical protein
VRLLCEGACGVSPISCLCSDRPQQAGRQEHFRDHQHQQKVDPEGHREREHPGSPQRQDASAARWPVPALVPSLRPDSGAAQAILPGQRRSEDVPAGLEGQGNQDNGRYDDGRRRYRQAKMMG